MATARLDTAGLLPVKRSVRGGRTRRSDPVDRVFGGSAAGSGEGGALQRAKDAGSIKVGIAGEVPFGYTDGGKVTGEAPEVAKAVFKALGIDKVESDPGRVRSAHPGAQRRPVRHGRRRYGDQAGPVRERRSSRCRLRDADGVPGAQGKPAGHQELRRPQGQGRDDRRADRHHRAGRASRPLGIAEDKIQTYDGQPELLQALRPPRAYCGALTDISLRRLLEDNPTAPLEVTEGFVPVVDGKEQIQAGGFVFRKGDNGLGRCVQHGAEEAARQRRVAEDRRAVRLHRGQPGARRT